MKILVAIASYGNNNDDYLRRLLDEYRSMPHDVDIVVLSNIQKELGAGVEVAVGLPISNPWSLPFAHKPIFVDRANDYDLFIYSEDDTLITQAHIDAFLWATSVLEPDEIAGFLRSEQADDGTLYYSTIHNHYHWDAESVRVRGGETFAHFTNEHGACYLLTREQLRRCIDSGGFSVPPHEGKYDLLVSAATDPYTQCGFKKLICVSRLAQFSCKHLTNKYIGRTGLRSELVDLQVQALIDIGRAGPGPRAVWQVETSLPTTRWAKSYYEPCRDDLVSMVPVEAGSVLSIGCGWGKTEEALIERGKSVTAMPLDIVIGRLAAARGIRIVAGDYRNAPELLAGETFDSVLISNLLHIVDAPDRLLQIAAHLLAPDGTLVVSFPNMRHVAVGWRRLTRSPTVRGLGDYRLSGVHWTSSSTVGRWLRQAGLRVDRAEPRVDGRWMRFDRATLGALQALWAEEYAIVARRRPGWSSRLVVASAT